jgi:hypothetical protein
MEEIMKTKIVFTLAMLALVAGCTPAENHVQPFSCDDVVGTWSGNMGADMNLTDLSISKIVRKTTPNASLTLRPSSGAVTYGSWRATCREDQGRVFVDFRAMPGQHYGSMDAELVGKNTLSLSASLTPSYRGQGRLMKQS